jgi:hypothetical protein
MPPEYGPSPFYAAASSWCAEYPDQGSQRLDRHAVDIRTERRLFARALIKIGYVS